MLVIFLNLCKLIQLMSCVIHNIYHIKSFKFVHFIWLLLNVLFIAIKITLFILVCYRRNSYFHYFKYEYLKKMKIK